MLSLTAFDTGFHLLADVVLENGSVPLSGASFSMFRGFNFLLLRLAEELFRACASSDDDASRNSETSVPGSLSYMKSL